MYIPDEEKMQHLDGFVSVPQKLSYTSQHALLDIELDLMPCEYKFNSNYQGRLNGSVEHVGKSFNQRNAQAGKQSVSRSVSPLWSLSVSYPSTGLEENWD